MAEHTTFGVGGPAEVFVVPANTEDAVAIIKFARSEGHSYFVLGGGANIVVADAGMPGIVIETSALNGVREDDMAILAGSGAPISEVSAWAAESGRSGLDFVYSMPGSVGGAVWMNARCYDSEILSVLTYVDYLDEEGCLNRYIPQPDDFGYKRSPFQSRQVLMTEVGFSLGSEEPEVLWVRMREHEEDRRAKGHFAAPCAGSAFKNNREFGEPSGKIIDRAGLRGFQIGGAKVSDLHANIIINAGGATATDIRRVVEHVTDTVRRERGFALEPEILFVGDWGER